MPRRSEWLAYITRRARFLLGVGFATGVFILTQLFHHLLVPAGSRPDLTASDLIWRRMLADGVAAIIIGWFGVRVLAHERERRLAMRERLKMIAEMNHHIRNALEIISHSAYAGQDQQARAVINESVERIQWALRELLGPGVPLANQAATPRKRTG